MNGAEPKEGPILFSAPMVRAILAGTKTQTRRVAKLNAAGRVKQVGGPRNWHPSDPDAALACPYGQPFDRLWVRETFYAWGRWETRFSAKKGRDEWHFVDMTEECEKTYRYPASMCGDNGPRQRGSATPQWWKRPAIHMPRVASRILLDVAGVRVERLNEISNEDIRAEGACMRASVTHRIDFQDLWESINGPGSWDANPWVWAVEFRRLP